MQMTGREKILGAFTPEGTSQFGVVTCYNSIFMRDHWSDITKVPWYYWGSGIVEEELTWIRDYFMKTGLEWLTMWARPARTERQNQRFIERQDGVWLIDEISTEEKRLIMPIPGGSEAEIIHDKHIDLNALPQTPEEVDELIYKAPVFDKDSFLSEGHQDLAVKVREVFDAFLYSQIQSPLWSLYELLGFEGMMIFLVQDRDLAEYAGRRILHNLKQTIQESAAMGVDAIWIEEALTDQISPALYSDLNIPLIQECVSEIRNCGIKSIYYYCGNPNDRLDAIFQVGSDALHFEESKKGFTIDIEKIAEKMNGQYTLFGNLDSIHVLQDASEDELQAEIRRQRKAGLSNASRFVMSTGSPITPRTPLNRVRLYTDIVHQLNLGL